MANPNVPIRGIKPEVDHFSIVPRELVDHIINDLPLHTIPDLAIYHYREDINTNATAYLGLRHEARAQAPYHFGMAS